MRALGCYLVAAVLSLTCFSAYAKSSSSDEAAIKSLEQDYVAAFRAKDVSKIMSFYAPGDQVLVFDLSTPRQYSGHDAYTKDWEDFIKMFDGPITVEMSDLDVTAGHDVAFGHNIQHVSGKMANGTPMDMTVRVTDGYQKINGKWLIVHEHVSVPIDMTTGKPDLQSKP